MTEQKNLTRAARRDLAAILAGNYPALCYGPYEQLVKAGYITGPQDNYRVVDGVVEIHAQVEPQR